MTTELEMLTWATALTILLWIPYTLAHIMNIGLLPTLTYKSDDTPLPALSLIHISEPTRRS